jgi:type I restriction enzyme S subunit
LTNGPQGLQKSGLPLRFQSQFGNSVRKYARRVHLALLVQTFPNLNAVALVPSDLDGAIGSTGFHVLRANEGTEPRWLYYAVQNRSFVQAMSVVVQGALYPAVRPKDIRAFEVDPPSIGEQRRIVAEIEKQFSRLDEAVAGLRRVKANLKRYKAAVLKAAVEGRLVPTEADLARREGHSYETGAQLLQRILETRRSQWQGKGKYKEPDAPDTTDLPKLPDGWALASLGQCFHVAVGATPSRKEPTYWDGDIPWISSGEVQFGRISVTAEHITDQGLANSSTQLNPAGSVLLGMIGQGRTRGQAALLDIEAANNQNCAAIWVSKTPVPQLYVFYWLMGRYEETRRAGSGNNQQALNKRLVEAIPIPLPPLPEQHRIVAEVDRLLSIAREAEAEVEANLKRAQVLRQTVLARSFQIAKS